MLELKVKTQNKTQGIDITGVVNEALPVGGNGILFVFCPHTTVGLTIGESEEDLMGDLERTATRLLDDCGPFRHARKGNPNAPAHLFGGLMGASVLAPVRDGQLSLGTHQSVILLELDGPKERRLWLQLVSQDASDGL
jgi:secondary thiamine-phosphate synthase enzyme